MERKEQQEKEEKEMSICFVCGCGWGLHRLLGERGKGWVRGEAFQTRLGHFHRAAHKTRRVAEGRWAQTH